MKPQAISLEKRVSGKRIAAALFEVARDMHIALEQEGAPFGTTPDKHEPHRLHLRARITTGYVPVDLFFGTHLSLSLDVEVDPRKNYRDISVKPTLYHVGSSVNTEASVPSEWHYS